MSETGKGKGILDLELPDELSFLEATDTVGRPNLQLQKFVWKRGNIMGKKRNTVKMYNSDSSRSMQNIQNVVTITLKWWQIYIYLLL